MGVVCLQEESGSGLTVTESLEDSTGALIESASAADMKAMMAAATSDQKVCTSYTLCYHGPPCIIHVTHNLYILLFLYIFVHITVLFLLSGLDEDSILYNLIQTNQVCYACYLLKELFSSLSSYHTPNALLP